jgi:hypothetical protein
VLPLQWPPDRHVYDLEPIHERPAVKCEWS